MRSKHVWATARQIARWHALGLLPRPRQRPLGRGRGTQTAYQPGTATQLVALIRSRRANHRLRTVALDLWLQGFAVASELIRGQLDEHARRLAQLPQALTVLSSRQLDDSAVRSRELGPIRRRVGANAMPTALRLMVELATGSFTGYSDDKTTGHTDPLEPRVMEKVLGLTRARTDRIGDAGPWLPKDDDLGDYLKTFSAALGATLSSLVHQFRTTSDAELDELRKEFSVLTNAARAAVGMKQLFGSGAGGMTVLATLYKMSLRDRVDLLVMWPALHQLPGFREQLQSFASALSQAKLPTDAQIRYVDELKREVPEIARAMDPKRLRNIARTDPDLKEVQPELLGLARKNRRIVLRLRRETGLDSPG